MAKKYTSMKMPGATMVVKSVSKESKMEKLYQRITDLERLSKKNDYVSGLLLTGGIKKYWVLKSETEVK